MRIFRSPEKSTDPTAVALGFFDGVHLGHRAVIGAAAKCRAEGLCPAVFTFSSPPRSKKDAEQLTDFDEKLILFEKLGIERVYALDFEEIKNKTPEEFVIEIVKGAFNAQKVFCGFNFLFGCRGAGNTRTLKAIGERIGIEIGVVEPVLVDGEVVSSTRIRSLLREGEIEKANVLLGHDFGLRAKAVEGRHIGTLMDTPTINLEFGKGRALPKFGVYGSVVTFDGEKYAGVTNIGVRPTVGDNNAPNCETFIPGYKGGALYGREIDVRLKSFIRPERKFSSLDELKSAIQSDAEKAYQLTVDS